MITFDFKQGYTEKSGVITFDFNGNNFGSLTAATNKISANFSAKIQEKISFNFVDLYLSSSHPDFNFGVIPDNNEAIISAVVNPITANFNAKLILNSAVISATTNKFTGEFIGEFDYNTPRYLTQSLKSEPTKSLALSVSVFQNTNKLICLSSKASSFAEDASVLAKELLENTAGVSNLFSELNSNADESIYLSNKSNVLADKLNPLDYDCLIPLNMGIGLSLKISATLDNLDFIKNGVFSESILCNLNQHHQSAEYYLLPDVLYFPSNDFELNHESIAVDTIIQKNLYQSKLLVNFDFSEPSLNDAIVNFDFSNNDEPFYDYHYSVYSESDSYIPSTDFVLPYSSTKVFVNIEDQTGVLRNSIDANLQLGLNNNKKICSKSEKGVLPSPGKSVWIDYSRQPIPPSSDNTHIIPERRTYFMQHSISVELLDGTPISVSALNLSFDADSFAWSFSGTLLDKNQVSLIKQIGFDPVQLSITINGYNWKVIIEKITKSHAFGKKTIGLQGRGLTALLSAPYLQKGSQTQGSLLTVQQIADLQMPFEWSINWNSENWLIPGGAYSHQRLSPIQALMSIARNIGSIVVPSKNSQEISIESRYKYLPWQFDLADIDVVIPESIIITAVERPLVESQINGVYVHGSDVGGQIGFCRLNGTAGDRMAETHNNNLMTDPTGLRALGERILAGEATQPLLESIVIPLDAVDLRLIEVGQLIEATVEGVATRGIVNSVSIHAELGKVRQTIQIGEKTANQWTAFKELLPADPLLIATLSSTTGTSSIMTMLDSGVVSVRGTGTVGDKYYIRAGKIDSDAPNLTQHEIVI